MGELIDQTFTLSHIIACSLGALIALAIAATKTLKQTRAVDIGPAPFTGGSILTEPSGPAIHTHSFAKGDLLRVTHVNYEVPTGTQWPPTTQSTT